MNILLCIGCDDYLKLSRLQGAEKDARNVFQLLNKQGSQYPSELSQLLLSPKVTDIREALNQLISGVEEIDVFTFFFAGHGAAKAGSFYLCTKEAEVDRLSTTAYSISSLFQTVNELQPKQANIIIDACQAGSSAFDLSDLVKCDNIGTSTSSSIAFFGACAADRTHRRPGMAGY